MNRHLLYQRGGFLREDVGGGFLLEESDEGEAKHADGQHSDAAHGVEREGSSFRALFGGDAEHGGPEKRFAEGIQRGGGEDRAKAGVAGFGKQEQSADGEDRAHDQQTDGRELMIDRAGEEAHHHHDGGGVNQNPTGIESGDFHGFLHQAGDPAVRAEFGDRQRNHDDGEENQQRSADALGHDTENDHGRGGEAPLDGGRPAENVADLRENQAETNERADCAEFLEHFQIADARGFALVFRKLGANEHDQENHGGHKDQTDHQAPVAATGLTRESEGGESAEH